MTETTFTSRTRPSHQHYTYAWIDLLYTVITQTEAFHYLGSADVSRRYIQDKQQVTPSYEFGWLEEQYDNEFY